VVKPVACRLLNEVRAFSPQARSISRIGLSRRFNDENAGNCQELQMGKLTISNLSRPMLKEVLQRVKEIVALPDAKALDELDDFLADLTPQLTSS
jgi:hypothetical protein